MIFLYLTKQQLTCTETSVQSTEKTASRNMTLKSGIRAVLAKTALIPLLTLIPVFTLKF